MFDGHIAGFGTRAGVRFVVGMWGSSPLGTFTDVMVQHPDGERVLLAPSDEVAEFVSTTYRFDRVEIGPVNSMMSADTVIVSAPRLDVTASLGAVTPLGRLLRLVPSRIATAPLWLRAVNPVAALVLPSVRTAGSAGAGRREYYGVRSARRITDVAGRYDGRDLGGVAPLRPPVSFGFSSAPPTPQLVDVRTTIDGG